MPDAHKNFAVSTVATAPSPATSGTSLVVATGHGSRFPTVPFNATVWPSNAAPDPSNAEIVRVTAISTDTLTITRAQESTTARSITVGDRITASVTAKSLTDVEDDVPFNTPAVNNSFWLPSLKAADLTMTASRMYCQRIVVPRAVSVDRYNVLVNTSAASSSLRFGLYTDGSGYPGALVAGSEVSGVSSTSTGWKNGSITALALSAGIYWIACVAQGGAPGLAAVSVINPVQNPGLAGTFDFYAAGTYYEGGVTGALPSFSAATIFTDSVPRLALRRSA